MRATSLAALTASAALLLLPACRKPAPQQDSGPPQLAPDTSWVRRAVIYEVFVRDFSPEGNLAGVTAGLDRIRSASADVVWLMPIHPVSVARRKGTLGSPYAIRDYRAIDSAFGTADDLRALVRAAHERGMKVILDWVPDHTGWDHAWITGHAAWYVKDSTGQISVPRDLQGNLTDWTDVAQLDYRNAEMRREMIATMRWWLTEFDLDGYRVDVAGFLPHDFYEEALPQLRAAVPRPILLLAEWGDRAMHRVGFDLSYGWDGYNRLKGVWGGDSAASFARSIAQDQDSMPAGGMRLRFTTNHDETAWDNPPVLRFANAAGARAAFVAMALLPGRPMLYNGQEVESPQKLRLFERDAILWEQRGAQQAREFYRRVLDLARNNEVFVRGSFVPLATSAPADVIAYRRENLVVLVNARRGERRLTVDGVSVAGARDLLTGRVQPSGDVTLPAYGAVVLELRPPRPGR